MITAAIMTKISTTTNIIAKLLLLLGEGGWGIEGEEAHVKADMTKRRLRIRQGLECSP